MSVHDTHLAALYQAQLLDHGRNPRHAKPLAQIDRIAECDNPLCGDRIALGVRLSEGMVADIGFDAQGCLISVSAASLLCCAVRGGSALDAHALCVRALELVAARVEPWPPEFGELAALAPVARFPARRRCASLAFSALAAALGGEAAAAR